jgi:putative endonuclease
MEHHFKRLGRVKKTIWQRVKYFFRILFLYILNDPLIRIRFISILSTRKSVSRKFKDQLARAGEDEAVIFLMDLNYIILQRNVILFGGEIDIIASDGGVLVFIEVKTRSSKKFGQPYEAVTLQKQKRLHKLAKQFINSFKLKNINYRIDIISIIWQKNSTPEIKHIKII